MPPCFAAFISITAIMPHAVHCGKPRAGGGSHAIADNQRIFRKAE
jgi:hypothetical protein